ncbi:hypothetical protein [Streptomyces noursei]|uniref:hypothetical protein n=1 Tax=Streptomyces noursei TaxID=1971 RepID=UPI001963B152|nr:hypothetical protein [Streptomyces noursei]QRX94809.1 hypothetical protein JNO44_31745 [Streptomyces noursei]
MPVIRVPRRPTAPRLMAVTAVVLLGLVGWYLFSGRGAGLLPQDSWGPWREKRVHHWSVWVRVNSWSDAAEADGHYGKADGFTLKAHGTSATTATVTEDVRFTLAPDGELTVDGPRAS